jgi:hypothetical protein
MKFPLIHRCSNGHPTKLWFYLDEHSKMDSCNVCGESGHMDFGTSFSQGRKVLVRAQHEWEQGDWNMAIICAASAVECELSEVYQRWQEIGALDAETNQAYEEAKAESSSQWQKQKHFLAKFAVTTNLVAEGGWKAFLAGSPFEEAIQNRFPSLGIDNFPRDVQRELFDRRNRAIHQGVPTFSREESLKCVNIALLVMMLLDHMHQARAKELGR